MSPRIVLRAALLAILAIAAVPACAAQTIGFRLDSGGITSQSLAFDQFDLDDRDAAQRQPDHRRPELRWRRLCDRARQGGAGGSGTSSYTALIGVTATASAGHPYLFQQEFRDSVTCFASGVNSGFCEVAAPGGDFDPNPAVLTDSATLADFIGLSTVAGIGVFITTGSFFVESWSTASRPVRRSAT